jgi:hypothetical protein
MPAVTSTPCQGRRATLPADASIWNALQIEVGRLLHQTPTEIPTFVVVGLAIVVLGHPYSSLVAIAAS